MKKEYFRKFTLPIYEIIILLILLSPHYLKADDTLIGESGKTAYPINTEEIRMVSEDIKIVMKSDPQGSAHRMAFVTCEFVFENTTSEEIKAKIGFPSNAYSDYEKPYYDPPLVDFKAYIDGIKQEVDIKKEIFSESKSYYSQDLINWKEDIIKEYRYWYTWDIAFPPSKRIKVKNIYSTILSMDAANNEFWFVYILKTGANWKGNIEKARIEMIYKDEDDLKKRVTSIQPKNYNIQGNKIIWEFYNFEPSEDILIYEKYIKSTSEE